jgi:glutamate 5-kinase
MNSELSEQSMLLRASTICDARRIVIKIGSALLTRTGNINRSRIRKYISFINQLRTQGREVCLVSSGAVASAGSMIANDLDRDSIHVRQALAAIGQARLMSLWNEHASRCGFTCGQILLSESSLKNREQYKNARATLDTLLALRCLPVINENDTIATEALQFGGNDILGALVCGLVDADLYCCLTDVDGYYVNFGSKSQTLLPIVKHIDRDIEQGAGSTSSEIGTGGMSAKIKAARIAGSFGVPTLIANGNISRLHSALFKNHAGTLIMPGKNKPIRRGKRWIASGIVSLGNIYLDEGAVTAVTRRNASVLPRGVLRISGSFNAGDPISVCDHHGREFAKGRSSLSSSDLKKIVGRHSRDAQHLLSHDLKRIREAVHRDYLVITDN